jgi:hypothetical protein
MILKVGKSGLVMIDILVVHCTVIIRTICISRTPCIK